MCLSLLFKLAFRLAPDGNRGIVRSPNSGRAVTKTGLEHRTGTLSALPVVRQSRFQHMRLFAAGKPWPLPGAELVRDGERLVRGLTQRYFAASSRCNQALANCRSRRTVRSEEFVTSAVSSSLKPPK